MGVLPTREGETEVIQPMIQRRAGDADAVLARVGKIGQAKPARWMLLPEDDVLLGAVERPPGADATFQRTANAGTDLGMTPPELIEDGDRTQAGDALEQRDYLTVPDRGQRVRPPPVPRRLPLRRQSWVLLDAIGAGGAEPGFGRGDNRRLGLAQTHVQPHLLVGDVAAGQGQVLIGVKNLLPIRSVATASQRAPFGAAPFAGFATSLGLRPPDVTHPAAFSS